MRWELLEEWKFLIQKILYAICRGWTLRIGQHLSSYYSKPPFLVWYVSCKHKPCQRELYISGAIQATERSSSTFCDVYEYTRSICIFTITFNKAFEGASLKVWPLIRIDARLGFARLWAMWWLKYVQATPTLYCNSSTVMAIKGVYTATMLINNHSVRPRPALCRF